MAGPRRACDHPSRIADHPRGRVASAARRPQDVFRRSSRVRERIGRQSRRTAAKRGTSARRSVSDCATSGAPTTSGEHRPHERHRLTSLLPPAWGARRLLALPRPVPAVKAPAQPGTVARADRRGTISTQAHDPRCWRVQRCKSSSRASVSGCCDPNRRSLSARTRFFSAIASALRPARQ